MFSLDHKTTYCDKKEKEKKNRAKTKTQINFMASQKYFANFVL